MKKVYTSFLIVFLLFPAFSFAQQNGVNKEKYRVSIKKAVDKIEIDGQFNEESWKTADVAKQFHYKWPKDEGVVPLQTEVQLTYDDDYLYVAATCKDDSKEYVIQTLKRDNVVWMSDGIMLILDPVNQQSNGFAFYTNALGAQTEGLITLADDDEGMSRDWDNKWFVETKSEEDGQWYAEMAIPFKTLRFDSRVAEWGINFLRCDLGNNAYSTWAHIPLQFNGTDLSYAGTLVWDNPPKATGSNISIIPYITGDISQDMEGGDDKVRPSGNAGLDAKIAVSSSLNLDLTINPDFSQVEVDVQQTNLTRFSLFFPERRTFFLENSDIFSDFGIRPIRPFFSRRIGLDEDGNAIPILGGARLSGNLTENFRIGVMSMQTGETDENLGQNYSVAAFQQRVFKRSTFKGIAINRQAFGNGKIIEGDFGRNLGGEFNYITPDGKWTSWAGYHASFQPEKYDKNGFGSAGLLYSTKKFTTLQSVIFIGENFLTDAGFALRLYNYDADRDTTVRIGFQHIFQMFEYSIYPKAEDSKFSFHRFGVENYMVWDNTWFFNYRNTELYYQAFLANSSSIRVGASHTAEWLPFATNLFGDEYDNLESGWYSYGNVGFEYGSNSRKLFSFDLSGNIGQFYNGSLARIGGGLRYRKQPWGAFELNFERNVVTLPENYGEAKLWLLGPRIEINFNKNLFWTTFLQYNTQADNFNINSRLQWRFKPMSDLFIVYTDNYQASDFAPKNRALVFKLNYWLTL
jgi:hypothetical protein